MDHRSPGTKRHLTRRSAVLLAASALALGPVAAAASDKWPADSITIVVAYQAGGGTDITVRALTETLGAKLGTTILVQNVAGAGGGVAAAKVAKEKSDGYTLLATNST